jgi:hypothetical protein
MTRLVVVMTFLLIYACGLALSIFAKKTYPNSVLTLYSNQFLLLSISFVQIATFVIPREKNSSEIKENTTSSNSIIVLTH